jgi:hypothetical protein
MRRAEVEVNEAIRTLTKHGILKWAEPNVSGSEAHAVLDARLCQHDDGRQSFNFIDSEDTLVAWPVTTGVGRYLNRQGLLEATVEVRERQ